MRFTGARDHQPSPASIEFRPIREGVTAINEARGRNGTSSEGDDAKEMVEQPHSLCYPGGWYPQVCREAPASQSPLFTSNSGHSGPFLG